MTLLLQILGFAALSVVMRATPQPLRLHGDQTRRRARIGGMVLLGLSILAAVRHRPIGFAILDWFGLATLSAALVLLVMALVRVSVR